MRRVAHTSLSLEIEHPEVAVLLFQELVPDVNVQPVGRIAIS